MSKNFTQGMIVKRHEKAPNYVICGLSFKVDEFTKWLQENEKNGWVNVDVKLSQNGKYYGELNSYEKSSQTSKTVPNSQETTKDEEYTKSDNNEPTEEDLNSIPF